MSDAKAWDVMKFQDRMTTKPFTIALCHQKGGVGKSSSAAALGASFSEKGYSTLLIDLDPSGNLTAGLGFSPDAAAVSPAEAVLHTTCANLDLMASNAELVAISHYLLSKKEYENLLLEILLDSALSSYDLVIIDCPPALDALTIMALTASDLAILPTPCEYYSLQALESVFALIRLVRSKTNPALRYRLLITMFDRRGTFHRRVLEQIRAHYQNAILETVIGFDTKIRESQLLGVPITKHASNTRAAVQYRALAEELERYVQREIFQPA